MWKPRFREVRKLAHGHTGEKWYRTVSNTSNLNPDPQCHSHPRAEAPEHEHGVKSLSWLLLPLPHVTPTSIWTFLQMLPDRTEALHHSIFLTSTPSSEVCDSPTHPLPGTPLTMPASETGRRVSLETLRETLHLWGTPPEIPPPPAI